MLFPVTQGQQGQQASPDPPIRAFPRSARVANATKQPCMCFCPIRVRGTEQISRGFLRSPSQRIGTEQISRLFLRSPLKRAGTRQFSGVFLRSPSRERPAHPLSYTAVYTSFPGVPLSVIPGLVPGISSFTPAAFASKPAPEADSLAEVERFFAFLANIASVSAAISCSRPDFLAEAGTTSPHSLSFRATPLSFRVHTLSFRV